MRAFRSLLSGNAAPLSLLAAAALALLTFASPVQAEDIVLDGIVATVNGKIITRFELDERLRPVYEQMRGRTLAPQEMLKLAELRRQTLDQMIDDLLILQDSERYKLKVSDAEVEEQIKEFRAKRQLSEEDFKKQLAMQRMSREDFIRNMRRDLIRHRLIGGVVSNKVVVTDSEVEQQYLERKAEFSKDSMVQLAMVLLPAGVKALDVKNAIETGQTTFAEAANKYTQGPGAGQGGDIGFIAWKDLAPDWSEALRGLKPGQITPPVRVQEFEGLLQVVSLKEGEELPLDAVREQIYQSLHEGKFEKVFQEYMKKQRDKAVIEYRNL
ncbi:MAG: SurA N-terminal domain-containing protein [Proteobacteria bacterium]|nr:SurA N-terminal domain-containing protein [Pseudomonadota bacterium]MBU1594321.1 SurA N-terminal domain-containing protein [Pseudomonadota bacterium]